MAFVHNTLGDAAAEIRFLADGGLVRLSLRQSAAGSYTALVGSDGTVALYRGGEALGTALVAPAAPGTWRILRLSAIGDIVRVAVDGLAVIAAQDAAPLPPGTLSFAGMGVTTLTVDDVSLWIPETNVRLVQQPTIEIQPDLILTIVPTPTPAASSRSLAQAQSTWCQPGLGTVLGNHYAIIAAGDAGGLCAAISASASTQYPYNIFLDSGQYTLQETLTIWGRVRLFGQGIENTIITQLQDTNGLPI